MSETFLTKCGYAYTGAGGSCAHSYILTPLTELIRGLQVRGRIVDLGCGNGSLSHELCKLGFEVHGIDQSESGIRIARKSFPQVRFVLGDIEANLTPDHFGSRWFDIVVSTEVVEHLYDPRRLVENAFRLLKPAGYFVVSTPYHGYLKNLALAVTGKLDSHFTALWDGGHIKFWSRKTLSVLLTEAGFTDIRFLGAGRIPCLWKSMILIARKPEAA